MGVKFGIEEETEGREGRKVHSSMPNFTPISATCRPYTENKICSI